MLTVWIALLLWAAPTQGVTTNCVIPAVERFQNTSLTCKFSDDISTLKQDFKVQFYKSNTTDSTEVILDCYWVDKKPECTVHKCCEYDGHVTETLTLRVLNVTESRAGRYVCFVLPAAPDSYNFCNFTLTEKQHTVTSEGSLAALAVLVVIPLIICIIIIIIVWRRKRQKPGGKTSGKKPCHFWPGQWYSAKEKPDDEESKQPLNKNKDEANDGSHSTNFRDLRGGGIDEATDSKAAEKLGQKSDDIDRSQRPVHTRVIERIRTWFVGLYRREPVNQNVVLSSTPQQESSLMKNDTPSTSMTGPETKPEEIEKDQTGVSSAGTTATVIQSQKMQSSSGQNDVITPIADQSSDDGTRTTRKTLCVNEFQTEYETKDQKTQESDAYKYTTNITKEGRKVKNVRKEAKKKEKAVRDKAEKDEKIATDKAEKEIKSAREKAEKEEKLVKENAEKEETIAKGKAEELEKIAKDKAEGEEKIANEKAKEEEKLAKDKAEKEKGITKKTSKKMSNTSVNIEEKVNKISNEKEDQMTKIGKRKEEQMEIIAKEKDKQLEKIAKEKREELEKIANAREKRLEEISKRKMEEIERIKKKKEEEIEEIKTVRKERMQTIIKEKDEQIETIKKKKEEKRKKNEKVNKQKKKDKDNKQKKKGKDNNQTAVRESLDVQRNDEQLKINETEDDDDEVEHVDEIEPCLDTKGSNVKVNSATRSQSAPHTIIQMSELASHQDTSEAPTGTQEQTLQAVDNVGTPVKNKTIEDKESNRNASTRKTCTVS